MRFLLMGLAAGLAAVAVAAAQDDSDGVLRVDVTLVTVDVEVYNPNGRAVTDLTREDFLIYEDGRLQQLMTFAPTEDPYKVMLLYDCSLSTEEEMPFFTDAAASLAATLGPQDQMAIGVFAGKVTSLLNWDKTQRERLGDDPNACGYGTVVNEAIEWAIEDMRGLDGRKAIVMLTDGQATDSNLYGRALSLLRESDVRVYFVALDTDLNPTSNASIGFGGGFGFGGGGVGQVLSPTEARFRMQEMAEVSAGGVVFPTKPSDLIPLYEDIGKQLRSSYTLGFVSNVPPDGTYREIQVRIGDENARVEEAEGGGFRIDVEGRDEDLIVRQSREGYTAQ